MFSVKVDSKKNRIYVTLGEMGAGEGEKLVEEIKQKVAPLKKEFTGVSDITNFSILAPEEAHWADIALKTIAEAGMTRAVRVTRSFTTNKPTTEKYGYVVSLCKTVEEADKVLDEYEKSKLSP